jgi:hypothetical protein
MRYQDWDVILYPKGCQVPFKEFKTTCYAVQAGNGGGSAGANGTSTPSDAFARVDPDRDGMMLMFNCRCSPDTASHLLAMPGLGDRALWQIKIIVDGLTTA